MNYAEIQAQIAAIGHRNDLTNIPEFIARAENHIFRELVLKYTLDSAIGTTSGDTITLPANAGQIDHITITSGGTTYTLDYTSPNGVELLTSSTDQPTRFVVEGNEIRLLSYPSGNYSYILYFIPAFTPLSVSNTTNWISTNAPDVYIYAGLVELARFSIDDRAEQRFTNARDVAINAVKREDERKRFPMAGGLQIKVRNAK